MPRLHIILDFRIFNLEEERSLLRVMIKLLCHSISRSTNFNSFTNGDFKLMRLGLSGGFLGLPSGSLSEISLVALPLSVGQVVAFVVV